MRATIVRWGRRLLAFAALTALAACAMGREPACDAALAGEVTELTAGTLRLFQDLAPGTSATYEDREPQYRALGARAETVRLMAQARGSAVQPGGLIMHFARLGTSTALAEEVSPEAAERLAEYRDATAAYMGDCLRNLSLLENQDRVSGNHAERLAAYEAVLAGHQRAVASYLEAFKLWQAGQGPRPEQPPLAPEAPAQKLESRRVSVPLGFALLPSASRQGQTPGTRFEPGLVQPAGVSSTWPMCAAFSLARLIRCQVPACGRNSVL